MKKKITLIILSAFLMFSIIFLTGIFKNKSSPEDSEIDKISIYNFKENILTDSNNNKFTMNSNNAIKERAVFSDSELKLVVINGVS